MSGQLSRKNRNSIHDKDLRLRTEKCLQVNLCCSEFCLVKRGMDEGKVFEIQ